MAQSGYDVVMLISGLSDHSSNVVIIFSKSVDPSVTHETVLYLAVVQLVKYRTRKQELAGSTHTLSTQGRRKLSGRYGGRHTNPER